jgi:hypothetical protein
LGNYQTACRESIKGVGRTKDSDPLIEDLRRVVTFGALSTKFAPNLDGVPSLVAIATRAVVSGAPTADEVIDAVVSSLRNAVVACDERLRPTLIELYGLDERRRNEGSKVRRSRAYRLAVESGMQIVPEGIKASTFRDDYEDLLHRPVAAALRDHRPRQRRLPDRLMVEEPVESPEVRQSIDWATMFQRYEVLRHLALSLYTASYYISEAIRNGMSEPTSTGYEALQTDLGYQLQFWIRIATQIHLSISEGWYPFVPSGDPIEEACLFQALTSLAGFYGTYISERELWVLESIVPHRIQWTGDEGRGALSLQELLADDALARAFVAWQREMLEDRYAETTNEQRAEIVEEIVEHCAHLLIHLDHMFRPASVFLKDDEPELLRARRRCELYRE